MYRRVWWIWVACHLAATIALVAWWRGGAAVIPNHLGSPIAWGVVGLAIAVVLSAFGFLVSLVTAEKPGCFGALVVIVLVVTTGLLAALVGFIALVFGVDHHTDTVLTEPEDACLIVARERQVLLGGSGELWVRRPGEFEPRLVAEYGADDGVMVASLGRYDLTWEGGVATLVFHQSSAVPVSPDGYVIDCATGEVSLIRRDPAAVDESVAEEETSASPWGCASGGEFPVEWSEVDGAMGARRIWARVTNCGTGVADLPTEIPFEAHDADGQPYSLVVLTAPHQRPLTLPPGESAALAIDWRSNGDGVCEMGVMSLTADFLGAVHELPKCLQLGWNDEAEITYFWQNSF